MANLEKSISQKNASSKAGRKLAWRMRGSNWIPEEMCEEGSGAHSGVHSVPQVLVYLKVTPTSSFGVIDLSRLIRAHTGQGRTLLDYQGTYKETGRRSTAQQDPLPMFGLPSNPPCPSLLIPGQKPMCTYASTQFHGVQDTSGTRVLSVWFLVFISLGSSRWRQTSAPHRHL